MPGVTRCRECDTLLAGKPHVLFGAINGLNSRICIVCVAKHQKTSGVPTYMDAFVIWYRAKYLERESISALQARIRRYEEVMKKRGIKFDD